MAPIDSKALLTVEQDAPVWKHSDKVPGEEEDKDVDMEMTWYELEYKDYILKFTLDIFGSQPKSGFAMYVGLHGGGGTTDRKKQLRLEELEHISRTQYPISSSKARPVQRRRRRCSVRGNLHGPPFCQQTRK